MAVKASATITLTSYRDTQSVTRYYKLKPAGSSAPLKPETKPPSSDWTDSEPACDISKELYFCDLTIFSNGEGEYSKVSKSTSYEAAKQAYHKAQAAKDGIDNLEIGGRNYFSNKTSSAFNEANEFTLANYQNTGSFTQFINLTVPMKYFVGKKCILSFDCISPNGSTPISVYNQNGNPRYLMNTSGIISPINNEWIHQELIITVTDRGDSSSYNEAQSNKIEIYCSAQMGCKVRNVKLEIGNRATDWTPAPEDVQAEIDRIKKRVVIGEDSVDIVDSTGKLLASYGDAKIELGKNAVSSIIEMCGGMSRVSARYGGLTTIYSDNGGYQTTLDYDFNETIFKSRVGSNYGFYEFIYSGGVWECSYSGNNAGYVQANLSDYGITLKTTSVNEYAGITIHYWNGSEATFINADTTKPSRKLILGLAESGTSDNPDYASIEIERSKEGNVEHSKINLLTVHDGANVAGVHLDNGNIELDVSGEVLINGIPLNDYIVEQGTYIGWKYRKWNSGIAECFGYISLGSISVSAEGNMYRGNTSVSLPAIFNDIPSNVHITNGDPLVHIISINGRASDANTVLAYVWKATKGTVDVKASFHVIGTWK